MSSKMPSPRKKVCRLEGDIDEELKKLPLESVNDRVSCLDLEITENTVVDKPHWHQRNEIH